jgi:tetratricopeptide (TPR) repeat protein
MGQIEEASSIYSSILDTARKRPVDVDILSQIAWCNYRLKAYDEAIRLYREALILDAGSASIQFTLALSFICSGRLELGLQEYRKGIDMSQSKSLLARRGVLHEALRCLKEARNSGIKSIEEREVRELVDLLNNETEKTR